MRTSLMVMPKTFPFEALASIGMSPMAVTRRSVCAAGVPYCLDTVAYVHEVAHIVVHVKSATTIDEQA